MDARILPTRQMQPIDLVAPGFRGLNLIQAASVLPPAFCTEALNGVLDDEGRLRARRGFQSLTNTPLAATPTIRTLHEYINNSGTTQVIVAWNGGISNSFVAPGNNDISGSVVDANGSWHFVNFNSKVIGFQSGQAPIVWSGSGNFASIVAASGSNPTGGIGTAAYGRVWGVRSDLQTIDYSALLDETNWSTGGGAIDMRNVWAYGTDTITAVAGFNSAIVVFGRRQLVVLRAPESSVLGIDPDTLYVADVIPIGCLTQHSIQAVGQTDLLFLSSEGVQSLARLLIQKNNPVQNLSKYVRGALLIHVQAETLDNIRSAYSALHGFYMLSLPTSGTTWIFDQRRRWTDEEGDEVSIVTRWSRAPTALLARLDNTLLASVGNGRVHLYAGATDDGTTYRFIYQSPWLDLGEELANRLKILKRLGAILFISNDTGVVFKWSMDFQETFRTINVTAKGTNIPPAEFGESEFGIAEYGGGIALRILKLPARGTGQYFRIAVEAVVTGDLSLQQAELFTKIGRLA